MGAYGLKDCMKRLGLTLLGRPDPVGRQVQRVAREIQIITGTDPISLSLGAIYDRVVNEPIPADLSGLLNRLPLEGPRSYRPRVKTGKGGKGA